MNSSHYTKTFVTVAGISLLAAILVSSAFAKSGITASNEPTVPQAGGAKTAKVADLAFLAGHWEGTVDTNKISQQCSVTDPTMMLCMFWMTDTKGTQMVEIYTIRDTIAGVEERVRFMSPELNEEAGSKGVTMKLASYTPRQFVFENASGGTYPKRSTLTRVGDDQFTSRIELVDAKGQTSLIQAHWTKVQ